MVKLLLWELNWLDDNKGRYKDPETLSLVKENIARRYFESYAKRKEVQQCKSKTK